MESIVFDFIKPVEDDVNKFIKQFSVCYSLYDFHEKINTDDLLMYKKDLKRFQVFFIQHVL